MPLTRSVDPIKLPVTLESIREHTNVTDHRDDAGLEEYMHSATRHIELLSRKQLITQTWRVTGCDWPGSIIELPKRPLVSVTSVKYHDSAGDQQTVDSALYTVDTDATPGRIVLNHNETWPSNRGHTNDIEITFVCGFGDTGASVPDTLIHAIKMMVSHWKENREAIIVGTITVITPMAVKDLYYAERDYASPDPWWDN
jgi:uncharacterized phiE125 gp8 family phage protein